ncbi:MAG: ABC transporter ATP-binding protein [Thermoleophilia bacterium]|nr:ABC transporter ATP-binding protein [Thermoleophilia bacterium]
MILRAENLSVGYGHHAVLRDIDIEMLRGQFVGILGPNGCGKTTLLRTIVRALSPLAGTVYLDARRLSEINQSDLAKQMAVVLTDRVAPGLLTVFDVVAMGRYPYTGFLGKLGDDDKQRVWDALNVVEAADLAHRHLSELSDGEAQKALIARALAQEPELIVLDEPTSHLDARHRVEVMRILRGLVVEKQVTVLTSLHDVDLSMKVCDLVVLVKGGRMLDFGPPEEVLAGNVISELYDMNRAGFSNQLGGIEFRGAQGDQVFVVAGAGSGAPLYRVLTKHDMGLCTGILPENDVDFHVAVAVGATVVSERPYETVSAETYARASELMASCVQVVDGAFPVGDTNGVNVELFAEALTQGKIAYTLRSKGEAQRLFGSLAGRLTFCPSISTLAARVRDVQSLALCGNGS